MRYNLYQRTKKGQTSLIASYMLPGLAIQALDKLRKDNPKIRYGIESEPSINAHDCSFWAADSLNRNFSHDYCKLFDYRMTNCLDCCQYQEERLRKELNNQ